MIPIDDPDDPRVAPFRAVRDRDLARQDGLFVAEGGVVVRTLLSGRSRFRAEALLVADAPPGLALARDFGGGVPTYLASRPVMAAIAGFPIHRGILAVARRGPPLAPAAVLAPPGRPSLVLVLAGLANHDNVGGAFRNAAAFGADAVLLDAGSCDPLYRKAVRVSVGAALVVAYSHGGRAEAVLAAAEAAGYGIVALSPSGREPLGRLDWPDRTALVVGAEGPGLPDGLLSRWRSARIEMRPGFDSLNVATASGIALHAARSALEARHHAGAHAGAHD